MLQEKFQINDEEIEIISKSTLSSLNLLSEWSECSYLARLGKFEEAIQVNEGLLSTNQSFPIYFILKYHQFLLKYSIITSNLETKFNLIDGLLLEMKTCIFDLENMVLQPENMILQLKLIVLQSLIELQLIKFKIDNYKEFIIEELKIDHYVSLRKANIFNRMIFSVKEVEILQTKQEIKINENLLDQLDKTSSKDLNESLEWAESKELLKSIENLMASKNNQIGQFCGSFGWDLAELFETELELIKITCLIWLFNNDKNQIQSFEPFLINFEKHMNFRKSSNVNNFFLFLQYFKCKQLFINHEYQTCSKYCESIVNIKENWLAYKIFIRSEIALGNWEKALNLLQICLNEKKLNPSWILNCLGVVEMALGRPLLALSRFKNSFKNEKNLNAIYNLIKLYRSQGNLESEYEMLENLSQQTNLNDKVFGSNFIQWKMAKSCFASRNYFNAFHLLNNLIESKKLSPDFVDSLHPELSFLSIKREIIKVQIELKNYDEVFKLCNQLLDLFPFDVLTMYLLSENLIFMKKLENSLEYFEKIIDIINVAESEYNKFLKSTKNQNLFKNKKFINNNLYSWQKFDYKNKIVSRNFSTEILFNPEKLILFKIDIINNMAILKQATQNYQQALKLLEDAYNIASISKPSKEIQFRRLKILYNKVLLNLKLQKFIAACSEWINYRFNITIKADQNITYKLLSNVKNQLIKTIHPPIIKSIILESNEIPIWFILKLDETILYIKSFLIN